VCGQGGGGALAVSSCNADYLSGAQFEEDIYLGRNKPADPPGEFEKFIVTGNGRVGHNDVCPLKIRRVMRAQMKLDVAKIGKSGQCVPQSVSRRQIRDRDPGSGSGSELSNINSAAETAQAHD
jgi:hypothetical protein